MTKLSDTVHDQRVISSQENPATTGKNRGYDELAPFLHEVNKIVAEECALHTNFETLPWYATWEKWNDQHFMRFTAINNIGIIVCPELKYIERTVENVIKRIVSDITPVSRYIQINHISDTSVQWESLIEVDSFKSLKRKSSKKSVSKKDTKPPYRENSPSHSNDNSTLSSNHPSIQNANTTKVATILPLSQSMDTAPLPFTQLPAVSPADDNPPKEVIITNEKSLTSLGYSNMKTTAIADMKLMIAAATEKSKEEIGQAIKIAQENALTDINKEYDSILKELGTCDKTKEDVKIETASCIEAMKKATIEGLTIKDSMTAISTQTVQMNKDIVISRASLTTAHKRKKELDELIAATAKKVTNLKDDTESIERNVHNATTTSTEKAIGDATSYLSSHNSTLLHKMERVFAENMDLMVDEKNNFNVEKVVQQAIEKCMADTPTLKLIEQVTSSIELNNTGNEIIQSLVKRQRKMEETFKTKMDRDFTDKCDISRTTMNEMLKEIEGRVDKLSITIDSQMDTLDTRQIKIVTTNNKLYEDIDALKIIVAQLESKVESTGTRVHEMMTSPDIAPESSPGIEPGTQRNSTAKHSADAYSGGATQHATFMASHRINTGTEPHPILTPSQFLYPLGNYHVKEVESYKFQKAKLNVKCSSEDYVFTFYNTLRHVAKNYNILLLPLSEVSKINGVCQLTPNNCVGYEQAHENMSTALHIKLVGSDYFKSFDKAKTYIDSASNSCNGFRLLYRILEIIHPRLRLEKGGLHKTIDSPSYSNITDDSVYTFIKRYENYLLYEEPSPQNRTYTQCEQTMFIIKELSEDKRFKDGLLYVQGTLQNYQQAITITPTTPFPLDIGIEEIAITIDEHSDDYTVGDKAAAPRVINPYARDSTVRTMDDTGTAVIRALGRKDNYRKPPSDSRYKRDSDRGNPPTPRSTQTCKACMGIGHCITDQDSICYNVAKAHMCNRFIEDASNAQLVKSNTYRYRKDRKEKSLRTKRSSKLRGAIRRLEAQGHTPTQLAPMIHMACAMEDSDDSDYDSSSDSDASVSE